MCSGICQRISSGGGRFLSRNQQVSETANYLQGFTLAEVIITLGIIGVVAALTVPTLIAEHRSKELETRLKKSYSLIGQVLDMYYAENGERVKAGDVQPYEFKEIIKRYVKVVRECESTGTPIVGCIPASSLIDNKKVYKTFNTSTYIYMNFFDDGQLILPDGTLLLIENAFTSLYVSVDVNGYNRNPNRLGHDLFIFSIDKDGKLIPGVTQSFYESKNDDYCSKTSTNNMNGAGCTYKALTEPDYFKKL